MIEKDKSLAYRFPELAKEWHLTKNGDFTPAEVTPGSGKKVWWRCSNDHEWQATIANRSGNKSGCPYCSGKKAWLGFNDLQTVNPKLAHEWHPTRNNPLTPEMVVAHSDKRVWWLCQKGHEWEATIKDRQYGNGCPYCAGRLPILGETDLATVYPDIAKEWHPTKNGNLTPSQMTPRSNKKVWWKCERGHEWSATVDSRSKTICPICTGRKVLVGYNDLATTHPTIAAQWHFAKNGQLTPQMITHGSTKKIWWKCKKGHEWQVSPNARTNKKTSCPYCSNRKVFPGYNDLETTHPEIARQWHPTKNGDIFPQHVSSGSSMKVWWMGDCAHEWEMTVRNRVSGQKCPYCSGKRVLIGYNDLTTQNPELAQEWYPHKNILKPSDVTKGANVKVWWRCFMGHEWQATVANRSKGSGCPYCYQQKRKKKQKRNPIPT